MRDEWEEMRELLERQVHQLTTTKLAASIGIGREALTHFINGRLRKGVHTLEKLNRENEAKVRTYLRRECDWPPRLQSAGLNVEGLSRMAKKTSPKSEREQFAESLDEWGEYSLRADEIRIKGYGWERFYRPEGGLTEADYYFFAGLPMYEDGRDLWATELAGEVVKNLLLSQGRRYLEADWAVNKLELLDMGAEEIERRGFDALVEEALAALSGETGT